MDRTSFCCVLRIVLLEDFLIPFDKEKKTKLTLYHAEGIIVDFDYSLPI